MCVSFTEKVTLIISFICVHVSVSEENKRSLAGNEGAPTSIPQKQKTSKAERRAIQEAQRAAKAAAKEAGNYHAIDLLDLQNAS